MTVVLPSPLQVQKEATPKTSSFDKVDAQNAKILYETTTLSLSFILGLNQSVKSESLITAWVIFTRFVEWRLSWESHLEGTFILFPTVSELQKGRGEKKTKKVKHGCDDPSV